MSRRSVLSVFILSIVTFGAYALFWMVETKEEMNAQGAKIPTVWLLVVPFANIYFIWRYCEGVEQVSGGRLSARIAFLLLFFTSFIGPVVLQSVFNKLSAPLSPEPRLA
jgi:hypothetical protein